MAKVEAISVQIIVLKFKKRCSHRDYRPGIEAPRGQFVKSLASEIQSLRSSFDPFSRVCFIFMFTGLFLVSK